MVIVKDINLNFEDTELETLYIHLDEKGRAYRLLPPVDVSGLSCRVEMVKPDNTFVIQDLETGEDGIILEIPEQAGAVVGVGWYNISFRDGDTVIYTCYGRYQIDDHLISDSMVESIAEVNGYQFPDDFVTQGDIDHVADEVKAELIKDNIYSDSATWSSEKIANFVNDEVLIQVDNIYRTLERITTYSTSEQVVGKWIDGSDVYELTVNTTSPATANSNVTIADLSSYNIDKIISIEGVMYASSLGQYVPIFWSYNYSILGSVYFQGGSLMQIVTSGYVNASENIIIRYTKTTATRTLSKGTTTD